MPPHNDSQWAGWLLLGLAVIFATLAIVLSVAERG